MKFRIYKLQFSSFFRKNRVRTQNFQKIEKKNSIVRELQKKSYSTNFENAEFEKFVKLQFRRDTKEKFKLNFF